MRASPSLSQLWQPHSRLCQLCRVCEQQRSCSPGFCRKELHATEGAVEVRRARRRLRFPLEGVDAEFAAKLAPGIWARGYNGTDRENSQYEVVSSQSITHRRPCEVARTNDGNSVLVLATFSEPQRLCLVVPASSSLSQCDGQWRAARRALPGRFAAQWPCEGCGRLALPILLTCRSAPRGPVAESSGGAEIERARFGRRGWTCAAARVRHVSDRCGKIRLAAWPARPFE